jgi:hypothetical protein
MAELIDRARFLVRDPAAADQHFSQLQIQDALDQRRWDVRYLELQYEETLQAGGTVAWFDYYADRGYWEDDYTLQEQNWVEISTGFTANLLIGHFQFTATKQPPVFLTGRAYDLYAAAADLLETWLAELKLSFDFSVEGQSFTKTNQQKQLTELAHAYRARSQPLSIPMVRRDMYSTGGYQRTRTRIP